MRDVTPGELLSLREFLMMESTALMNSKAALAVADDKELHGLLEEAMRGSESRIKNLQRFIEENGIASMKEVQV